MKNVLVTGATGKQGSAVVAKLIALNNRAGSSPAFTVYALTRDPTSAPARALETSGVKLIKGSLSNKASLVTALRGMDAAFLVNADGPDEKSQALNFIEAAQETKLAQLVYGSAEGAGANGVPALEAKLDIENEVKRSGIPLWTILRPVAFYENLQHFSSGSSWSRWVALGLYDVALAGRQLQFVAVEDIANVAAQALASPTEYKGRTISIVGDKLSVEQMLSVLSRAEGRKATKVSCRR